MQAFRYKDIEYSEVMFSELDNILRVDAEYFQGAYLRLLNVLKKKDCKLAQEFAYITDGIHSSIDFDENSNINLISAKSPKENIFDLTSNSFISLKQHEENSRTELKKGDVILSTVGTIGNCAVVDESVLPANADRHVGIIRIQRLFSPYYLASFLLSKYGRFQTIRESTGNVQLNLFIIKLNKLRIPLLSKSFQITIENLVKEAHQKIRKCKLLYQDAENLLLEELGLKDWQLEDSLYSEYYLSESFGATGRLDAEFFQSKYDQFDKIIKSYNGGCCKISDCFNQNKKEFEKTKDGFNYIEISDIDIADGKANYNFILTNDLPANAKIKAQKGDIIVSKVRPYRGAVSIIDFDVDMLIVSSAFTVLTEKFNSLINKETLKVLLRSYVFKELLLKYNTGASYPVIKDKDVLNIDIPIISKQIQYDIKQFLHKNYTFRVESERLLHIAKQIVERAVETSEEEALSLIEQNGLT